MTIQDVLQQCMDILGKIRVSVEDMDTVMVPIRETKERLKWLKETLDKQAAEQKREETEESKNEEI